MVRFCWSDLGYILYNTHMHVCVYDYSLNKSLPIYFIIYHIETNPH